MKTKQLVSCFKKIAEKYGVGFKADGEKVKFYIHFTPDWEWHEAALLVWWEQNPGGLNWWEDRCFDGKHHISGPGYPAYVIHDQKPISEDELLARINSEVASHIAYYKQYKNHI